MDPAIRPILEELKTGLSALYGDRLDRVILYGSRARGDARPDSDIDVLVLLKEPFDHHAASVQASDLAVDLLLDHHADVSLMVRSTDDMNPGRAFYRNVLTDGVELWPSTRM